MPLIMDDDSSQQPFDEGLDDMRDLFDDAASVMPLPLSPSNPDLPLRLDELALSGCRQKLACASTGALARISSDGKKLHILFLARKNGEVPFSLSEPLLVDLPTKNTFQLPIIHTCWSPDGHNLAVFDSRGGLVIYQCQVAVNRLAPRGLFHFDDSQASGAVIGLEWLRASRTVTICPSVDREGAGWRFNMSQLKPSNVSHPLPQRNALITINRFGSIRLFYSIDMPWTCSLTQVGTCDAFDQLLTHASFCSYKDSSVMLVTYDVSRTLAVYEVKIDWHLPRDMQNQMHLPPGVRLSPTLTASRMSVVHHFVPMGIDAGQGFHDVELTRLLVLPAVQPTPPNIPPGNTPLVSQTLDAQIIACFNVGDAFSQMPLVLRSRSTRLASLNVSASQDTVHESFAQLASKKNRQAQNSKTPVTLVKRSPDVDVSGTVVSLETARMDTLLSLIKSDGTVELLSRPDLAPLPSSSDSFMHPLQAGLSFPPIHNRTQFLLSTNCVMMISRGNGDDLKLHHAEPPQLEGSEAEAKSFSSAALAAVAMAFANGTFLNMNTDDIFEVMRRHLGMFGGPDALEILFMAVSANPDCVAEDPRSQRLQKMLLMPFVQRIMSFQQTLLNLSEPQSVAGKCSSVFLNTKSLCNAVHVSLAEAVQQDLTNGSDMPGSLLGLARYFVSLTSYLIDSLITTQLAFKNNVNDLSLADLQSYIHSTGNPTIPLVLCSTTRVVLNFASRVLRTITTSTPPWLAGSGLQVQMSWQRLTQTLKDAPVPIRRFEVLLDEINHHAREAYEAAAMGDAERGIAERRFLVTGRVPDALLPVTRRLLAASVNKLVDETGLSPMKLYMADYSELGLDTDERPVDAGASTVNAPRPGQTRMDILRKIHLAPRIKRARRCTRCQAVMEDLMDVKSSCLWLNKFGHTCVCGNRWVIADL